MKVAPQAPHMQVFCFWPSALLGCAYRARIDSGAYVYVGGHVCLSSPEYATQTKYGPRMTEWANRHVDECCLRFENIYEVDEKYEFHLDSINSDEEYDKHYNEYVSRGATLSPKEANERQAAMLASLSRVPGKALCQIMDIQQMTIAETAEAALVSDSTVKRWLREESSYKPATALRIIVALSLPPWITYWFLDMAKVPLQYSGVHLMYRDIINCRYMDSIDGLVALVQLEYRQEMNEESLFLFCGRRSDRIKAL